MTRARRRERSTLALVVLVTSLSSTLAAAQDDDPSELDVETLPEPDPEIDVSPENPGIEAPSEEAAPDGSREADSAPEVHVEPFEGAVRASFSWDAPPECADRDAVVEMVSTRLGRIAFVADDHAEVRLRASLERAEGFHAVLDLETLDGERVGRRELESSGEDCAAITESVAIVLAVMLNVRREELDLPPEPPEAPIATPRVGTDARLVVEAGLDLGTLPQPALEVSLGFSGGMRGVFDLGLEVSWLGTSPVALPPELPAAELGVQAISAQIVANVVFLSGDVELAGRLSAGGGPMWAWVIGAPADRSPIGGFVEVRAGLRFAARLASFLWLCATFEAGVLPYRTTFRLERPDGAQIAVFEPTIATGHFAVGPMIGFE